ncbi:MAG: hypothetical protein LBG26_02820 [Treponema sp.]|jgi:hypothetical protein|nr:hypothetical protein [Treponema sp.]
MGMRKKPRYESQGQVYIAEVLDTNAVLKNLSACGLCIESKEFMDIIPHSKYTIDILPEKESNIRPFTVDIESKWIRTKKDRSESGFIIIISPGTSGEEFLNDYLNFLSKHAKMVV